MTLWILLAAVPFVLSSLVAVSACVVSARYSELSGDTDPTLVSREPAPCQRLTARLPQPASTRSLPAA